MKKGLTVVVLFLILGLQGSASAVSIDITGAKMQAQSPYDMKLTNVKVDGYTGTYWVTLRWDVNNLVFKPLDAGAETVAGKTWTVNVLGSSSATYSILLTSYPDTRAFKMVISVGSGNPQVCLTQSFKFIQGNNSFGLSTSDSGGHDATIKFDTSFNGCEYVYQGQTITGTIPGNVHNVWDNSDHTNLPAWFDFGASFKLGIGSVTKTLNTDGTVQ